MPSSEALNTLAEQLNIYCGLTMFTSGIVGALWNILVFRHHSFRSISCSTYILMQSWASLAEILFGLSDRIVRHGFNIHWTSTNIAWCKIRHFGAHCASLIALSSLVFSVLDRFFSTCTAIRWRRLNSSNMAKQVCYFVVIVWISAAMPMLIFEQPIELASKDRSCVSSSWIWSQIELYFFHLFCDAILPCLFVIVFGSLTWRNLRRRYRQRSRIFPIAIVSRISRVEKQVSTVILLQSIVCVLSTVPQCVQTLYDTFIDDQIKSEDRRARENLSRQLIILAYHVNDASMFYVNCAVSRRYRRLARQVLWNLCQKPDGRSKDVVIVNHQTKRLRLRKHVIGISAIKLPDCTSPVQITSFPVTFDC